MLLEWNNVPMDSRLACKWLESARYDGFPRFTCIRCKQVVEVRSPDTEAVLRSMPPCGTIKEYADLALAQSRNKSASRKMLRAMFRYARAVSAWVAAGFPTRTSDEVYRIYTEKCVPCSRFNRRLSTCGKCGCRVNKSKAALLNKIRMGTEHCPAGRW